MLQGAADLPGALLTNHRDFLGSCGRIQLFFGVDVFQVQGDVVGGSVKQLRHAALGEPEGLVLKHHADKFFLPAVFIEQDLSPRTWMVSPCAPPFNNKVLPFYPFVR